MAQHLEPPDDDPTEDDAAPVPVPAPTPQMTEARCELRAESQARMLALVSAMTGPDRETCERISTRSQLRLVRVLYVRGGHPCMFDTELQFIRVICYAYVVHRFGSALGREFKSWPGPFLELTKLI